MIPRPLAARAELGMVGRALLLALAGGCVTQTVTPVAAPLWQPGTYPPPSPAVKPAAARRPAAAAPPALDSAPPPAATPEGTPTEPASTSPSAAAVPPAPDPEGQLQLLTPAEPELEQPPAPVLQREPVIPQRSAPTPTRVRQFFAYAALYGAGRCRFASCAQAGWNTPHADGESDSRCLAGDCRTAGWTTTHPDGTTANTRCLPGGCLTTGWSTEFSAAPSQPALTRCRPGGCATAGWSTTAAGSPPGTLPAETRCLEASCQSAGWRTRFPSGELVDCRCILRDCEHNGAECR